MKTRSAIIGIILSGILIIPVLTFSQTGNTNYQPMGKLLHEAPDQPYIPPQARPHTTAPRIKTAGYSMVQVNVDANGQNIPGDAANEPSMTIDPSDPQHILIGWRQFDNVNSNFRQAGYAYSTDGGQTWTFPGVINPGIFRSDPVLDCDSIGIFYYNSLTLDASNNYLCKVFKSGNGGANWDGGVDAHGGDKQWMAIDRSGGPGTGNIYADWNSYFTSCPSGSFTRSTDNGANFGDCTPLPGTPYWGTVAIGNNGEVYISGTSDVYGSAIVLKSTGAQYPDSIPNWHVATVNFDGQLMYGSRLNPVGLTGQVSTSVDRSSGAPNGNVYVLASVLRYINSDSADVMFSRSTDGGLTFSMPVRVNDDQSSTNYQWFGTMSVAPNGRIDATWLDTRDSPPDSLFSALYYSYSVDQGTTWSANQKLSPLFSSRVGWPQQAKMGDYVAMISDNNKAYLAWTNTLNGEEDVYFSTIQPFATGIGSNADNGSGFSVSSYPNPFSDHATVDYYLPENDFINLSLIDICGKEIRTMVSGYQEKGAHLVNLSGADIPRGYYFIRLTTRSKSSTVSTVRI
ncbi:MAG: T9SS type A sorting domain-containing protein [Bacteroidota bacterium]|jgi:Secretion system C-terminal sorting domain